MKKMFAAAVITVMTMSAALPVFAAPAQSPVQAPVQQPVQGYTQNYDYGYGRTRQAAPAPVQNCITKDEALQIAMDYAGVTKKDILFPRVQMEFDDGFQYYEVEFHVGWTEYKYDIDAVSGQIMGYESDWGD